MKVSLFMILIAAAAITLCAPSCGGGGGGSRADVTTPQYGAIEGYVYAPVGSGARVATATPTGYKAVSDVSVNISCGSTDRNTSTNSSGYFKIQSLPIGSCMVQIAKSGFQLYQTSVSVSSNKTTTIGGTNGVMLSLTSSGSIKVSANVSGGEVLIDGEETNIVVPATLSYTFMNIAPGSHTVTIQQTGYEATTTEIVNVFQDQPANVSIMLNPNGNQVPVAIAGQDQKGFVGTKYIHEGWNGTEYIFTPTPITITLDGTSSYDSDGDTLTYEWNQVSGPAVTLENPYAAISSFVPTEAGTYEISLKVNDSYVDSAMDTISVHVMRPSGKLVFVCAYKSTAYADLCIMNADGTDLYHLTDATIDTRDHRSPRWSPDTSEIAYTSRIDGTSYIATINSDGSNQNTTSIQGNIQDWFSDGDTVLFSKVFGGVASDYYRVLSDGTNEQRLTTDMNIKGYAQISPNGAEVVFNQLDPGDNSELMVMNIDGTGAVNITNNTACNGIPSWLPDGRVLYPERNDIYDTVTRNLYVINSDGSGRQELSIPSGVTEVNSPIMSDDSRFIFFVDQDNYLHIMYADGSASISYEISGQNPDYHPGP